MVDTGEPVEICEGCETVARCSIDGCANGLPASPCSAVPSECYPASNFIKVSIELRIPTTCDEDDPSLREFIHRDLAKWISYKESVSSEFVKQNAEVSHPTKED